MRVVAAVLTFNRSELLQRCLSAIEAQTRACDEVVVVDNASTDDTQTVLRESWSGKVSVHTLPQNKGASGGFNAAVRVAYQTGADFVWLMDDDVIPEPGALAALLDAADALRGRGVEPAFLVSRAVTTDGLSTNVPDIDWSRNRAGYQEWAAHLDLGLVAVTRATFVSILIPRETIATYGLPIASMFIWADDTEYTLRITAERKAYIVGGSKVTHLRAISGAPNIFHEDNPRRIEYHRYSVRNHLYVARKYRGRRATVRYIRDQAVLALRLCRAGKFRKAGVVISGLVQGVRFSPSVEPVDR